MAELHHVLAVAGTLASLRGSTALGDIFSASNDDTTAGRPRRMPCRQQHRRKVACGGSGPICTGFHPCICIGTVLV